MARPTEITPVDVEKRPVGRPPGTTESIESLARKDTQANLKLSERIRQILSIQLGRIESRLKGLDPATEMDEIMKLSKFLFDAREGLGRQVRDNAKIAMSDPSKANEGDADAVAKELIAQLKGDGG
jgi:hypothetical protein